MTEELVTEEHLSEDQGDEENILKVDPNDFEYDELNDTMKPKNIEAFNSLVNKHPSVNKIRQDNKREQKIENLKEKVLDTLKVSERRGRDLSCESVRSGCSGWGDRDRSTDSRGEVRPRSEDDEPSLTQPKKSYRKSRSLINPPKIVVTQ